MPGRSGEGPPCSSSAARRPDAAGAGPDGGRSGRVETEWRQQRENPLVATPQVLDRSPSQQSPPPQEIAPATAGQSTPTTRSPRNSQARRRRPLSIPSLYNTPGITSLPAPPPPSRPAPGWP